MRKTINSSETDKDSMYYPYSLEYGRSIHIEHTFEGKCNVWDSKMVETGLTRDEALDFCRNLLEKR